MSIPSSGWSPLPNCTGGIVKERTYGNTLTIMDKDGEAVARIVYSPDKPLDCGARVWIETHHEVEITA